jgi:hypothetical protein
MSNTLPYLFVFFGLSFLLIGLLLVYTIGVCSRCGHWSVRYVCPGCKRGRYDYTP